MMGTHGKVNGESRRQQALLHPGQESADLKKQPDQPLPDLQPSCDCQEQDLSCRERSAEVREYAVNQREHAIDSRESAAKVREAEAGTREDNSTAREKISQENEHRQSAFQEHVVRMQEVNKRLVIATINAQVLAEQLQQAKEQMVHLAHHDYLTSLPNRIQLEENLTQAIKLAQRHDTKLALLFMDLDRFKVINDSLGHAIGDQLLQAVAQRLLTSIRGSDTVSRQGGDEFIILLSEVDHLNELIARIEKIHRLVTEPYTIGEHVLHIGASMGISIFPDDSASNDGLIQHADAAMYAVKEGGRNHYAFFEKSMNERAVARHQMEASLHNALIGNEFVLYYQAQLDLKTGRITGAEALIRWRRPADGVLLPGEFMSFAQECGVMLPIGHWVLREACLQARRWQEAGLALDVIAVNVSAPEFEAKDFMANVVTVLDDTGLAPHRLELELTESVLMRDCDATVQKLNTLRAMGIRIAIDDFGTGYSSLSYLKRFPIDTLKIDQSFVGDIRDGTDDILVDTVINLGNRLKHHVIAEGIETAEQLAFLRDLHCTSGQGFHLSAPMIAADFTHILINNLPNQRHTPSI
jgi:diguanylate cyclase